MALSPNYSWAEPDNSSLVKNGAADIRTLGDAIDTSVWNVGFGQAGKNKIINGDFRIWQRGTTFDISAPTFTADRFNVAVMGNTGSVTQQSFTLGAAPVAGYESQYFARCTVVGAAGAGNYTTLAQRIEDVRTFAGQTVTVSYWAKADATKSVSLEFQQFFGSGGSASVNTFVAKQTLTTSWVRYSSTVAIPSISGKTIGTGSNQLDFRFWLSAGSDFNSRTSSLGTQSITFDIWGLQVEYGSKATPFQTASGGSLQGELAMCQRYYMRYYDISGSNAVQVNMGTCVSTTTALFPITHPVTLRANASSLDVGTMAASDGATGYTTGTFTLTGSNQTPSRSMVTYTHGSAALTQFRPMILNGQSASSFIGFSAEL